MRLDHPSHFPLIHTHGHTSDRCIYSIIHVLVVRRAITFENFIPTYRIGKYIFLVLHKAESEAPAGRRTTQSDKRSEASMQPTTPAHRSHGESEQLAHEGPLCGQPTHNNLFEAAQREDLIFVQ